MSRLLVCLSFLLTSGMKTDIVFVKWNKATVHSLRNQIKSAKENSERNLYENRLEAFKAYIGISNEDSIDPKSVRHQFLKALEKEMIGRDCYVVEANQSGEKVEIRNYVVYLNKSGKADVILYKFENEKWVKAVASQKINLSFGSDLRSYFTKFRLGFNQDDVIVTHFVDLKVKSSEYFLYSTLSNASGIDKILSIK